MATEEVKTELHEPIMSPQKEYVEINGYVVFWGLFYAALFALAVGYLCLLPLVVTCQWKSTYRSW